jgi:hypothetical protein
MPRSQKSFLSRRWWQILLGLLGIFLIVGFIAAKLAMDRLEPFVREKLVAYLEDHYKANVEIGQLSVSLPIEDRFSFLITRGQGSKLWLSVDDLKVAKKGMEDLPPLLTMDALQVTLDFPTLFAETVVVNRVDLRGFAFTIPPKGRRGPITGGGDNKESAEAEPVEEEKKSDAPVVKIEEIIADGMRLTVLPAKEGKAPLIFDMKHLRLFGTAPGEPLRYEAELTNPKPPGIIHSKGTFGPFNVDEPGDSPLGGDYVFEKADLSVFKGIRGILKSTGNFNGQLNHIVADGVSDTPDFGLSYSKNTIRLQTKYHAIIDGTNGNTRLEPVEATIGNTKMVCEGAVERFPGENGKTVELRVHSKDGNMSDILTLAMKDANIPLRGKLTLDVGLKIPPGKQDYSDRLEVSGKFVLNEGQFTDKGTRDKLNEMSSRASGTPNEVPDDDVTTDFDGTFVLANKVITLNHLRFMIPGAEVNLDGTYNLSSDDLDFHGVLHTDAKLSQMMKTRWKRWALKPVDPFFRGEGGGAKFNIGITGNRSNPNFGLERGRKNNERK